MCSFIRQAALLAINNVTIIGKKESFNCIILIREKLLNSGLE